MDLDPSAIPVLGHHISCELWFQTLTGLSIRPCGLLSSRGGARIWLLEGLALKVEPNVTLCIFVSAKNV